MTVPEIIAANIRARQLIAPGEKVLVGVSGGVDSVVLLRILANLREKEGWQLAVAHFNHQLRGAASDADQEFVRKLASELGLLFYEGRGDVTRSADERGESIEMAARKLRHQFLADTAREFGASKYALGHHAGDQVELFLLRLLRGTAGEGLTGMKWQGPSPASAGVLVVRPLLNISRDQIEQFASENGIAFQHDETNDAIHFQRNKVRHKLLPFLRENFEQNVESNLLRLVEVLSAEKEFLRNEADKAIASGAPFENLPLALQRQVLFSELLSAGIPPEFDLIETLREKAEAPVMVRPGVTIARKLDGSLTMAEVSILEFSEQSLQLNLSAPGKQDFAGLTLEWKITRPAPEPTRREGVELFDYDAIGSSATLRHWQPGDRFQPIGMPQPVKLQDLFTSARISPEKRRKLVVAVSTSGKIFWVEGLRIGEEFKISDRTQSALEWRWNQCRDVAG